MDKSRILPPQVRGRVTGVLDFFVDEIRLFRNIFLLTNNFDLVLQVQWWGEVLPVFIRPRDVHVPGRTSTNSQLLKTYYHSTKYEIKTTLDLFKLYLKNIEVLELSVLEAFENYVIGSAFLKDLIKLLNNNNELIKTPIIDYLGEEIGEVVIHVNYLKQKPQLENKKNLYESPSFRNPVQEKTDLSEFLSSRIKSDFFTLAEKTIFYDGNSKQNIEIESVDLKSPNLIDFRNSETMTNISVSETCKSLFNEQTECEDKESACQCLPEVKTLKDSSKVLYFGVNSKESQHKTGKSNVKITNKYNSNTIKCKSKGVNEERLIRKKLTNNRNVKGNSSILKREKQLLYKDTVCELGNTEAKTKEQSIPVKDSPNSKVLNYLLGSNMSKQDEETALNDFRKMSPSHNLVYSISELCLDSDYNSIKSVKRCDVNSSDPVMKDNLKFDFNNPIERSYYERFFLKGNSQGDFEIAELLNKPSKDIKLGDDIIESTKEENDLRNVSKPTTPEVNIKNELSVNEKRNNCARCKYYKKLDELDTIIESLKNFEQKILLNEKELSSKVLKLNSDKTSKRNLNK